MTDYYITTNHVTVLQVTVIIQDCCHGPSSGEGANAEWDVEVAIARLWLEGAAVVNEAKKVEALVSCMVSVHKLFLLLLISLLNQTVCLDFPLLSWVGCKFTTTGFHSSDLELIVTDSLICSLPVSFSPQTLETDSRKSFPL